MILVLSVFDIATIKNSDANLRLMANTLYYGYKDFFIVIYR